MRTGLASEDLLLAGVRWADWCRVKDLIGLFLVRLRILLTSSDGGDFLGDASLPRYVTCETDGRWLSRIRLATTALVVLLPSW